jgi:hypothetical protein
MKKDIKIELEVKMMRQKKKEQVCEILANAPTALNVGTAEGEFLAIDKLKIQGLQPITR